MSSVSAQTAHCGGTMNTCVAGTYAGSPRSGPRGPLLVTASSAAFDAWSVGFA